MKRNPLCLILFTSALLQCTGLRAYTATGARYTHKGTGVVVKRLAYSADEKSYAATQERLIRQVYPEAELLVSWKDYLFQRNCHDYAFGPFMSCMCDFL